MKLKLYRRFDDSTFIIDCISFEIRSNLVGNWIKCKTSDGEPVIFDCISKIETVEENIKK